MVYNVNLTNLIGHPSSAHYFCCILLTTTNTSEHQSMELFMNTSGQYFSCIMLVESMGLIYFLLSGNNGHISSYFVIIVNYSRKLFRRSGPGHQKFLYEFIFFISGLFLLFISRLIFISPHQKLFLKS